MMITYQNIIINKAEKAIVLNALREYRNHISRSEKKEVRLYLWEITCNE